MKSDFFKVVPYQEALRILSECFTVPSERVPLGNALGRVLSAPAVSPEDLPQFNRSTVDGYAVRASDTFGCSESAPAFLQHQGAIHIGNPAGFGLDPGSCASMPTGGMVPSGADAVAMVEYTERLGEDTVLIYRPLAPGENVIQAGEDVRRGEVMFPAGHALRPQDIGALAAVGIGEVEVRSQVRVGILSSGDEIVPADETPPLGKVRDVNGIMLQAGVQALGGIPRFYGIIPDEEEKLLAAMSQALAENDLVLISGGSSVGTRDMTLKAMMAMPAASLLFHGLAVQPGKPTMAVSSRQGLMIGLPGHPVSAYLMFQVVVAPLLAPARGTPVRAVLDSNVASAPGRDDFVRVSLTTGDAGLSASPVRGKSGLIGVMSRADGYIHIPAPAQGYLAGTEVDVLLFD